MSEYFVAWWNLENLFAQVDDPKRTDKLKRALGDELKGRTQAVLDRKLAQLASIIRQMNGGAARTFWACVKSKVRACSNSLSRPSTLQYTGRLR